MKKIFLFVVAMAMFSAATAEKVQLDTHGNAEAQATQSSYGLLSGDRDARIGDTKIYSCSIPGAVRYEWLYDDLGGKEHLTLTPKGSQCEVHFNRSGFIELFCYAYTASGQLIGWQALDILILP